MTFTIIHALGNVILILGKYSHSISGLCNYKRTNFFLSAWSVPSDWQDLRLGSVSMSGLGVRSGYRGVSFLQLAIHQL